MLHPDYRKVAHLSCVAQAARDYRQALASHWRDGADWRNGRDVVKPLEDKLNCLVERALGGGK